MDNPLEDLIQSDIAFSKLSVEKGPALAFKEFLTETSIMLPQNSQPILGIEAIYKSMENSGSTQILSWKPQGGKVSLSEDLGYTWGIYTLQIPHNNKIQGKYLNVWIKQADGTWKVEVDMGNTG